MEISNIAKRIERNTSKFRVNITRQNDSCPQKFHKVVSGDTLGAIAFRYTGKLSNWKKITEYNNIENPALIRVGHIIYIPEDIFDRDRGPSEVSIGRKTKKAKKPEGPKIGSMEKAEPALKKEPPDKELGELGEIGEVEFTEMGKEGKSDDKGETEPLKK